MAGIRLSHTREDRLGVGVFLATGQLPKNLGSLMSCLDALPTAYLNKLGRSLLYFCRLDHLQHLLRMITI
jgi:hypothetical protein